MFRTILCTSLVTLSLASGAALAADDVATARVTYDRATLTQPAAQAALHARIEHAADQVCGAYGTANVLARARYQSCYRQAIAGAERQVDTARSYALAGRAMPVGG